MGERAPPSDQYPLLLTLLGATPILLLQWSDDVPLEACLLTSGRHGVLRTVSGLGGSM
jgi:hypothetical protein